MRVVIDSNVWISALVFGGQPRRVFERAVTDGWTIVVSEEILTEVRRILAKKFIAFIDDFEAFYTTLQPRIELVALGQTRVTASRDEDDNRVLETALAGTATHIISGDKDLLVLKTYQKIIITTPSDFLQKNLTQK